MAEAVSIWAPLAALFIIPAALGCLIWTLAWSWASAPRSQKPGVETSKFWRAVNRIRG